MVRKAPTINTPAGKRVGVLLSYRAFRLTPNGTLCVLKIYIHSMFFSSMFFLSFYFHAGCRGLVRVYTLGLESAAHSSPVNSRREGRGGFGGSVRERIRFCVTTRIRARVLQKCSISADLKEMNEKRKKGSRVWEGLTLAAEKLDGERAYDS